MDDLRVLDEAQGDQGSNALEAKKRKETTINTMVEDGSFTFFWRCETFFLGGGIQSFNIY